jgi:hypothetical protein
MPTGKGTLIVEIKIRPEFGFDLMTDVDGDHLPIDVALAVQNCVEAEPGMHELLCAARKIFYIRWTGSSRIPPVEISGATIVVLDNGLIQLSDKQSGTYRWLPTKKETKSILVFIK